MEEEEGICRACGEPSQDGLCDDCDSRLRGIAFCFSCEAEEVELCSSCGWCRTCLSTYSPSISWPRGDRWCEWCWAQLILAFEADVEAEG